MRTITSGLMILLKDFYSIRNLEYKYKDFDLDIDDRVLLSEWISIINEIEYNYSNQSIGLEISKIIKPHHLGSIGYFGMTSNDLLQALITFINYNKLCYDFTIVNMSKVDDLIILSWEYDTNYCIGRVGEEIIVGGFFNFLKIILGVENLEIIKVDFTFDTPINMKSYIDFFNCSLTFNSKISCLYLPAEIISSKIIEKDKYLNNLIKINTDRLLKELPTFYNFHDLVKRELKKSITNEGIRLNNIAKKMRITPLSLQSKLKKCGYNFRDILNEVRKELALKYILDDKLTILDISIMLSYDEQTSFIRAFKSWTGLSPLQYRKNKLKK